MDREQQYAAWDRVQQVLFEVARERKRQEVLRDAGTIGSVDTDGQRLAVLVEEVGEVARAMNDGKGLREELIQVAAVAVAWLEAIDTAEAT